MSIMVDSGMTGLAPSGRKSRMSVSHGSFSVLVMVTPPISVFIFLSQRFRGSWEVLVGTSWKYSMCTHASSGIVADFFLQLLAGQDHPDGRVVDAVGPILL